MVEEVYSPGIYRPHGCGFIVGCDNHSQTTSYSVRYTPAYDSGIIHDKVRLSVYPTQATRTVTLGLAQREVKYVNV